jgi:hypothetical protein
MRRRARAALLLLLALGAPAALAIGANDARASVAITSRYTFEQTFGTAIRLIRVDLGLKITEKDTDAGYVLFEYTSPESGKSVHNGSVEVVRGKESVHVAVQLPAMPRYHEQMILDALVKKLAAEHGEPPKRPAPPPADAVDAGDAG